MEAWQWLVLSIPALVLVISVVMIVRVLTSSSAPSRALAPEDEVAPARARSADSPLSPAEMRDEPEEDVRLESDFDDLFRANTEPDPEPKPDRAIEDEVLDDDAPVERERAEETTGGGRRVAD